MKDRRVTLIDRAARLGLTVLVAFTASCLHKTGPEDPSPIPYPTLVSVKIEYRQPSGCLNTVTPCDGPVRFSASWMPAGSYINLSQTPGTFVWTGTATNVPANYPPIDQAYLVRVADPFLRDYQTQGATADRLQVGGQILTRFFEYGTPTEAGFVYIDVSGVGHNPS
jgi:hypothetical protein